MATMFDLPEVSPSTVGFIKSAAEEISFGKALSARQRRQRSEAGKANRKGGGIRAGHKARVERNIDRNLDRWSVLYEGKGVVGIRGLNRAERADPGYRRTARKNYRRQRAMVAGMGALAVGATALPFYRDRHKIREVSAQRKAKSARMKATEERFRQNGTLPPR